MRKYQFQKKILSRSIFMMLGVFIIVTVVFAGYFIKTRTTEFEEQVDKQLQGITSQIDNTLQLADDIALQIAANYQIIDVFNQIKGYHGDKNYFVENTDVDYAVKQHLISYMLKQNVLKRISLFDANQDFIYVGRAVDYGYLKKNCPNSEHFTDTFTYYSEQDGKGSLFRVDSADPYMMDSSSTISALREIKNYQLVPSECLGYVQVQIQLNSFKRMCKLLGKDTECYILDQKNDHILYSYQGGKTASEVKKLLNQTDDLAKGEMYCRLWESERYGIKILLASKNIGLIHSMISTLAWGFILLFFLIFIMISGQKLVIRRTTKPIVQMCDMLTGLKVDKNLQNIPLVSGDETDELRQLNYAFDKLVINLKKSMEKEMISRVNEIQSQMYALQTQMNPHFIHNILTVISAMSGTSECEKIPEVCEKLSSMIRYIVSSSEENVNLNNEVLHAENYLELMKIRYEDKFQYSMSYVGEIQNCHLPRFIIQPLLENCFAHGFHNKEFPWKIDIQIYCSEEFWEVQIRDNGCGMEQEELEKIKQELQEMRNRDLKSLMKEMKIGGLSIKNVYMRLFLAYGKHMIFDISNRAEGMCITVGGNYEDTSTGSGR